MAIKAVIDTNIWVSALLNPSGYPAKLRKGFEQGAFEVVVSEPILEEIAEVLLRPRIRRKYVFTDDDVSELLTLIEERADHVVVSGTIDVCRDKDDNFVIETAVNGKAACIVTRDDDVKLDNRVSSFLSRHGIAVLTVGKFLKLVE